MRAAPRGPSGDVGWAGLKARFGNARAHLLVDDRRSCAWRTRELLTWPWDCTLRAHARQAGSGTRRAQGAAGAIPVRMTGRRCASRLHRTAHTSGSNQTIQPDTVLTLPAWLAKNPAGVGQSFAAERLRFGLTSRLATPLDWPSHHTRPGPLSLFSPPESTGRSRYRIRHGGAKRTKEARQIRVRRGLIGRGLAR